MTTPNDPIYQQRVFSQAAGYIHPQAAVYTTPATYAAVQPAPITPAPSFLGLDVGSSTFWKGAILGAGLTLLVTNETVQKTVVKTVSKVMAAAATGVEEMKEKYQDAKAEVEAETADK